MSIKKAGTILLNIEAKQIGLVYRKKKNDYSFPKGHLEEGETLQECAIRETEEETMRANHLISEKEVSIIKYVTPSGEDVENYTYLAIDDGPTAKDIALADREELKWVNYDDVEKVLSYENLKQIWKKVKYAVAQIFDSNGVITEDKLEQLLK